MSQRVDTKWLRVPVFLIGAGVLGAVGLENEFDENINKK